MSKSWGIPCEECIVYAACRVKQRIDCEILYTNFRSYFQLNESVTDSITLLKKYLQLLNKFQFHVNNATKQINLWT